MLDFGRLGRREVQGCFDGGSMTSDGGVVLLFAADRKFGLTGAAARRIADPRNPLLITHGVRDVLRKRVYGLARAACSHLRRRSLFAQAWIQLCNRLRRVSGFLALVIRCRTRWR